MSTVVRYSLIRPSSTCALIETTCAPLIPRSVFDASWTAASPAFAQLSGDEPMILTTLATAAIAPRSPFVACRAARITAPELPARPENDLVVAHRVDDGDVHLHDFEPHRLLGLAPIRLV